MALGWLALLKTLPWTEVISAAPQVAGGARSLWDAVARKSSVKTLTASDFQSAHESATLRLDENEAALAVLHGQMLSALEVITNLADQNTLMIAKIEVIRVRMLWLSAITLGALLFAAGSLAAVIK